MSHELDTFADGRARMVYQEGVNPWHGLGQVITDPYNIPLTLEEAGLNFKYVVLEDTVRVRNKLGHTLTVEADYNRTVVKRETNQDDIQLTGVGSHWTAQGHQPSDLIQFFQEVSKQVHGHAHITTAGSLRRGGCVFGAAKFDKQVEVFGQDPTNFYLNYLMSVYKASDKVKLSGVQVVCNNTFEADFNRDSGSSISLPHYKALDSEAVSRLVDQIGLVDLDSVQADLERMSRTPLRSRGDRENFFQVALVGPGVVSLDEKRQKKLERELSELEQCYLDSPGQDLDVRRKNAYGAFSAVCNWVDSPDPKQAVGRRTTVEGKWSSILYGGSFDSGRSIKARAWDQAMSLAA